MPKTAADATAGEVISARLSGQLDRMPALVELVRGDEPEAVHDLRVAVRRSRAALTSFRPVWGRERVEPLRAETRWLAAVLGAARDTEVMRVHVAELLAAEPHDEATAHTAARLTAHLESEWTKARAELLEALASSRFRDVSDQLDELAKNQASTEFARQPALAVLPRLVKRDWRRVRDRVAAAHSADQADQEEAWHEARKAAKRARYAAEALEPVAGDPAARFAQAMADVQEVLGTQHDAVVTRELVRQLWESAGGDPDQAFGFGRLDALSEAAGTAAHAQFEAAWERASKGKLRRWLD
jgi:CHAD domain-containing protein